MGDRAGWLDRLHDCRASSPAMRLLCPLSDNATLLTIPGWRTAGTGIDRTQPRRGGEGLEHGASSACPPPMASACCDPHGTRPGRRLRPGLRPGLWRGERLVDARLRAGLEIACADGACVSHVGAKPLSAERGARARLRRRNTALLHARWPGYARRRVGVAVATIPLRATFERATGNWPPPSRGSRSRRLLLVVEPLRPSRRHRGAHAARRCPPYPALDTTVLALEPLRERLGRRVRGRDPSGARVVRWAWSRFRPRAHRRRRGERAREARAEHFFETRGAPRAVMTSRTSIRSRAGTRSSFR